MNSIPWLANMKDLSGAEFSFLILIVIIAVLATGFVLDVIARGSGFGPFLNGVLALIGVCAGIYLRYRLFAPFRADDLVLTIGFAIGTAFVLFFALGFAKSRLS
ncbi:hypothetical protein [Methylocapsa sp. S129]|uniref:hypothetical protein n=1 Tax=Methylocapsa sp. S129 TaxID=1641869 RepID=UPI00131D1E27|nr:hypothetical protein [Methylocapsa sp. S129]